ncbi:MAG: VOC family protein [Ignavibacteria bacterium]|nr:VOC family protein [Ignavibacteria bacterium]
MKIPDNTKIQSVDIKVKDLVRSLTFYSEQMGFKIISQTNETALLSATGDLPYLFKLIEIPNAVYKPDGTTGLFHIAIRLPSRKELARVFLRLFEKKVKFQGFSDHLVSEAIYLEDPDENGIELYCDRPKEEWQYKMGQVEMSTLPLNLNVLTNELDDRNVWNGIHPDTDIGHIHLSVSDLNKAQEIYSMMLGFNISNSTYPGALFFSAGGYHHYIGANVWSSRNGKPAPENSTGLNGFSISVPDEKFIRFIQANAESENLIIKQFDGKTLIVSDLDNNKITVTL